MERLERTKKTKRTEKIKSRTQDVKINYPVMFWLFFFGSLLGFVLEGLWQILKKGYWENHSSTILGPFCIIYGAAAMLLYVASKYLAEKNTPLLFFLFALLGASLEFLASLFQETVFGSTSWNYENHPFNIGGRVSLFMTFLWGFLGIFFIKLCFPLFNRIFRKMTGPVWNFICGMLSLFMIFNLAVTSAAVLRFGERMTHGSPPSNKIEEFFDENYDNGTMNEIFTNMCFD